MQAEVLSVDALADLERAIGGFTRGASEGLAAIKLELARQRALLDDQEEDARREVARWKDAAESAEEPDDLQVCGDALGEARQRLGRIRAWQARVREDHARFASAAVRFDQLLEHTVPRCRETLRSKLEALRSAAAEPLDVVSSATPATVTKWQPTSPPPTDLNGQASEAGGGRQRARPLTDWSLPQGFVWVPLSEVCWDQLSEIASTESYGKVDYATMVAGLRRLVGEVLPRIQQDPSGTDAYTFQALDEVAPSGSFENGLQCIYEAFFGHDGFIYLERRRGAEKYDIINGRHRIRIALELGWKAIPARVKDGNL